MSEFAGTLSQQIVIERAMTSRTPEGLATAAWETLIRCRASIAADGVGSESDAMALSAMARFRVTIRSRPGLAIDQRIRWRDRTLMIRQLLEEPRTPERMVLRCEEVRS